MYTIINNINSALIIKNSKFICYLYKINNKEDINNYLEYIREEYKDATHYCYAYILDNDKKCDDDKEPSNTAGLPILNVLEKNKLNYILCIVVRYYGGIKLGANGLVRAYTKSVTNTLNKDNIKQIEDYYNITLTFNYDLEKEIDYILSNTQIHNKVYNNKITYNIYVNEELLNKIKTINNIDIIINSKIKF